MATSSFPDWGAIWTGSRWGLVCVVGLLITPGPYHRIVEGGEDSGNLHRLVTIIADLALLPFALALGLDLFITAGRVFGDVAGAAAGNAACSGGRVLGTDSPDCESDIVARRNAQ